MIGRALEQFVFTKMNEGEALASNRSRELRTVPDTHTRSGKATTHDLSEPVLPESTRSQSCPARLGAEHAGKAELRTDQDVRPQLISTLKLEIKHIYDLEIRTIEQNNVAPDEHVCAIRWRWRQAAFQLFGAWVYPRTQARR
jgi:hypothetical protein